MGVGGELVDEFGGGGGLVDSAVGDAGDPGGGGEPFSVVAFEGGGEDKVLLGGEAEGGDNCGGDADGVDGGGGEWAVGGVESDGDDGGCAV